MPYWIQKNSFPIDELCLRVHRDIVWVHPFPNGNGRFSRIICDALRYSLGSGYFLWGDFNGDVTHQTANRMAYINALREADKGNYQPLLNFVR
ncbi:Fic family protein [Candidatus Regiella insecticola]|uniref:Fic family protein n=1 Tax=Candidatus Regiella insecticola TaxID=138073 RepID=UPI0015966FBE|nr:Fic family protein [Candidatus Regiella insecticola]